MWRNLVLSATAVASLQWMVFGAQQTDESTTTPLKPAIVQSSETRPVRSFAARGIIREIAPDGQTVVIRHEEIPDFMPKMTMAFSLRNTNEVRGLKAGDSVAFRVLASDDDSWIEDLERVAQSEPPATPAQETPAAALLNIAQLKPGDPMPDAELLAEDGHSIKLSDFKGHAVAFTFIFTRCPLPDFCPRMNQHFDRARSLLLQQGSPTNWQFLSISFDAEFDKPGILTRYAHSYRGSSADRWLFASAAANVMASFASQLDFRFANEGGSFLHNLRTVVLDRQGRLYHQFDGNKWQPEELAEAMTEAAQVE